MSLKSLPDFIARQKAFTAHVRDEHNPKPEGIADRRMQVYKELIFNNLEGFLSNAFPVLRDILTAELWHQLVKGYLKTHQAHSPLFRDIPPAFIDYLDSIESSLPYPFIVELAHYEYLEAYVMMLDASSGDYMDALPSLDDTPVCAPALEIGQYQFPVHQVQPDFLPQEPLDTPVFLLVYRKKDDTVGFEKLSVLAAIVLEQLSRGEHDIRSVIKQVSVESGQSVNQLSESIQSLLTLWYRQEIIWGKKK